MAISADWNVDFVAKVISHIDGVLSYENNIGTAPVAGNYIRGSVSLTTAKIVTGSDLGGFSATGTFTLSNVSGRFDLTDELVILDSLTFDTVTNGGFSVGDTLDENGAGTAAITVYAIEYNFPDSAADGAGTIYGIHNDADNFTSGDQLDNTTTGVTDVANATGAQTNGANFTGADVAALLTPPSGSDCAIINFDGGTEAIPRFCKIQDTDDASPNKTALVQKVYGVTATGSLRIIDTTGTAWANNDSIYVQKVPYDNLQTGQKFKVGDKIVTKATPGGAVVATGKVIVVETLTSTTGKLTLMNESGTLTDGHRIEVRTTSDTYVADINAPAASDFQDLVAAVNGSEFVNQLATQGGIYDGSSLNIIRDSNALYTYLQDTFDELGALDDTVPMSAQVALQQFTLINGWKIPDLSYRFLESGSIQDSGLDNIWTNYQTLGSVEGIGDTVYAATTPLPQFYIEQNGSVISPWWITGHVDVLGKVKTNTNPATTATADGVLINSGTITLFNRNYGDTYDHFQTTTIAGVAPVPLATSSDLNNTTGTHTMSFDGGTATQALTVGEEIVKTNPGGTDPTKRGIVTSYSSSDDGVTGTIGYILTGATQFADNDVVTGQTSTFNKTVAGTPTTLVAGYGTRIVVATVQRDVTYNAGTGAAFQEGETVTWNAGADSAILMNDSNPTGATGIVTLGNVSTLANLADADVITDGTRSVTVNVTIDSVSTIVRDIGDGDGDEPYNAVIYLNRDAQGNGDTLARMYEWVKYRTRSLETTGEPEYDLLGGKDNETAVQGRLYITQALTYPLVKASPLGTFAGGTFFGAQGIFVQDMASADIRSYQLIDANGEVRNPPNLQSLTVSGLVSGDRVAVFRLTGAGGTIDTSEYLLDTEATDHNGSGDVVVQVTTALTADTPNQTGNPGFTGVVRLYNATTQLYDSYDYTSVTAASPGRFLGIDPALTQNYVAGDNVYVPLIQRQADDTSESVNIQFVANIPILTRVRRKGILPFEVESTFTSAGASPSAIRSFDSIVD